MDKNMAASLDQYITENYWKIGDKWLPGGPDIYILCRLKHPYRDLPFVQFININTGNRYSDEVVIPDRAKWDGETISISEICLLIFGRDISKGTSDMDNSNFDKLENCHEYGPAW